MNVSSVVAWFAELPWVYGLAGRWTALLIFAWVAHLVLAKRDPRWRVLVWRSAAVGLATIVILTAAPPFVTWRLPRGESIAVGAASLESVAPPANPVPVLSEKRAQVARLQASTAARQRGPESAKRSSAGSAVAPWKTVMTWSNLGVGLLAIWLLGVAVMVLRLGLCVWRVSRIVGRSTEVPPRVIEECRDVAVTLGCRQDVRVVQTAEVPAPCLTGLFQPWLLLPEVSCDETHRADLRAILAHELAHVRRNDLVWNMVLHFWSIVLWNHPLVWRIRAAHLAACDAVCDALAADLVGDVASYGRTLARLALQVAGPAPVPGLAMVGTPEVFLRIERSTQGFPRRPSLEDDRTCSACVEYDRHSHRRLGNQRCRTTRRAEGATRGAKGDRSGARRCEGRSREQCGAAGCKASTLPPSEECKDR